MQKTDVNTALAIFFLTTAVMLIAGPVVTVTQQTAFALDQRVIICHVVPGNPAERHTITVGAPSVPEHIRLHGDTIGPCLTAD